MAKVPVICDSCQTFFLAEGIIGGKGASTITFTNCKYKPCPNCGGDCSILDGTYEFIENTIRLISGPQHTISELQQLAKVLQKAQARNNTAQEIKNQVNKELPKFSSLSDLLPKTRSELYAFIAIILIVIGIVVQALNKKETPKIEINQVINKITQNIQINPKTRRTPRPKNTNLTDQPQKPKKIGRNDQCPCKSGKKYKHCCGK